MWPGRSQVVVDRCSFRSVEYAFVDVLPTNVWSCERPGCFGIHDRVVCGAVTRIAVADEVRYAGLFGGAVVFVRGGEPGEGRRASGDEQRGEDEST